MSDNTRTNTKPQHAVQAGKRDLLPSFIIFMAWMASIGLLLSLVTCKQASAKQIATNDNSGYHSLTTEHSASNPRRHSLDIFMPKTYLVNTQQVTTGMNKLVLRFKRYTYGTGHSDVSCDGMSEPNKIPLWGNKFRGLNVVVVIPFYPFFTIYNKQTKHSGGHYHA